MLSTAYEFEVEIQSTETGACIARQPVPSQSLRSLAEDALWLAQRRGLVGDDRSGARCEVEPRFVGDDYARIDGVRLRVHDSSAGASNGSGAASEPCFIRDYPLDIFMDAMRGLIAHAVAEKRMDANAVHEKVVNARLPQTASRDLGGEIRQEPLRPVAGRLEDWRDRSILISAEHHRERATPVFIHGETFDDAREFCRAGGEREGGAMLVGRVYRQVEPEPELFTVIEATFEARHAAQEVFSLTPTTETFVHFETQLEVRRRRLDRPEEIALGFSHGHNFLPALDPKTGAPLCPACPKRSTCPLDSAFYSADDMQFHRALFEKRAFAIGLVFGLTPRKEDRVRVFGFVDGILRERSIWRVERPPTDP